MNGSWGIRWGERFSSSLFGLLDSAEATGTSQTLKRHRNRTPRNPGNSCLFSGLRPPLGGPPELRWRPKGDKHRRQGPTGLGGQYEGGGQCCGGRHLAGTRAQSSSKGHDRQEVLGEGTEESGPHRLHTGPTSACRGRPANDEGSHPGRKALSWVSLSRQSAFHLPTGQDGPHTLKGFQQPGSSNPTALSTLVVTAYLKHSSVCLELSMKNLSGSSFCGLAFSACVCVHTRVPVCSCV